MTAEVRLRPEAERDLADAAAWYEEQRQGLGRQFLEETQVLLSSISENPLAYSLYIGQCDEHCCVDSRLGRNPVVLFLIIVVLSHVRESS
jgi:hypothetical protein